VVNDIGCTMSGEGVDERVADEVVEEIRRAGGTAVASYDSVASPEGGRAIVEAAVGELGRLDSVVSNAGIFHTAPFDELTTDDWHRMLTIHLDGAFNLKPAGIPGHEEAGRRAVRLRRLLGRLVRPAQLGALRRGEGGTLGLANVIAVEGAEHGIQANCVLPFGYSRMVFETVGDRDQIEPTPGFLHAIEPELVVPVVTFLASRACALTHHSFSACAGRFARVFVGLGDGWVAEPGSTPTADDLVEHFDQVASAEPYIIPGRSSTRCSACATSSVWVILPGCHALRPLEQMLGSITLPP